MLSLSIPSAASAAYGDLTAGVGPLGEAAHSTLFPIDGPHDLGRNPANRFGGGRGHDGQDMFADCGTPVRAAQGGRVVFAGYQGAAGNYIVIRGQGTKRDYVYMHLRSSAKFDTDDTVPAKATIGVVGQTGDATACHLHFELWTPPGWYDGGKAIDPLPYLKQWAAAVAK